MEWVQQHPMLYDKSCEDYSSKEAKKQLYQQKALKLGVEGAGDEPGQRLQTWVKTQRDKVGRLMKSVFFLYLRLCTDPDRPPTQP